MLFLPFLFGASLAFDRFDPARRKERSATAATPAEDSTPSGARPWHALTPLGDSAPRARLLGLLIAEFKLLLWRQPWWWYAGAIGFCIAGFTAPLAEAVRIVVPMAWFWALTRWSEHGARAELHGTGALLASAAAPIRRILPAQWLAALVMGLALVAPVLLRLLQNGAFEVAAQTVVGAGFLAALALACGALSRGPRLFELLLLLLWYCSLQGVPGSVFGGDLALNFAASSAPAYLSASALLMAVVVWLRRRAAI